MGVVAAAVAEVVVTICATFGYPMGLGGIVGDLATRSMDVSTRNRSDDVDRRPKM